MPLIELSFANTEDGLSVRRFAVREMISGLFRVDVEGMSPNEDLDLEAIVGQGADLRVAAGTRYLLRDGRRWAGICTAMKQVRADATGLSTYWLSIEPRLWLLSRRSNYRVFQHLSVPDIVQRLLEEWRVEHVWRIDRAQHPKLDLRVQYGETDYAFLCRLLEEAGIAFYFYEEEDERGQVLLFHDRPQLAEARAGGAIPYVDNPNQAAEKEYVTNVCLVQEVRPGRYVVGDHDFRRASPLWGEAQAGSPSEDRLEEYQVLPGAFLVEGGKGGGTPVADDKGVARHDDRFGKALAMRSLEAARASRREVSFETNALGLWPGMVFSLGHHPRSDLSEGKPLLVTELHLEGTPNTEWKISGRAVLGETPYRPEKRTPKPHVHSIQSAVVVGPKGEEIHTDELGRVRVQFFWDREGNFDDSSSCWIRVSQGWAGSGFGMVAIPRVGQEVLVGFLGGNPDQPVVVGRLYNGTSPVPYKLPENKAVSGWKTASTPGSEGFNEIRFEDAKGAELVHIQAERNLTKLVKVDELETTGMNRTIQVGKRLVLTTGEASIILDGPSLTIDAKGPIHVKSTKSDVVVEGGPNVMINPAPPKTEKDEAKERERIARAAAKARKRLVGYATEPFWPGVEMRGKPEFREQTRESLVRIAKTRMGRALLRKMARTEHTATIVETKEANGACRPENMDDACRQPDGSPGKGCGSTVLFNPSFESKDMPKEVVLGHILARAYQNATGRRETGESEWGRLADLMTLGVAPYTVRGVTENNLRRNMNLAKRTQY